jgi:catechol 2,3-dioxygenase-like lactoylglutathione lyase family enzyme
MLKRITHTLNHVLDQDEALDFYVGKLGMVVNTDADMGFMRWLTVSPPDQPDFELGLMLPGPPAYDEQTAAEIRELVSKGAAGGGVIFQTDDCQGTYEKLLAAGVEFTQAPMERFYGTDCGLRDPFGNPIRFTQPPDGPMVMPSAEELRAMGPG